MGSMLWIFVYQCITALVPDGNGCYSIRNVQFNNCRASYGGGAISIRNSGAKLVCQGLIMWSCSTQEVGGAVCFDGLQCNTTRVCGSDCSAASGGFMHLVAKQSTVTHFHSDTLWCGCYSDVYGSISALQGQHSFSNFNSTNNNCGSGCGSGIRPDVVTSCLCEYGTFSQMKTRNCIDCIESTSCVFNYCNIVGISASDAVIYCSKSYETFNHCVFLRNSGIIFKNGWIWASIKLNNCVVSSRQSSFVTVSFYNCVASGKEHVHEHVNFMDCYMETSKVEYSRCTTFLSMPPMLYLFTTSVINM